MIRNKIYCCGLSSGQLLHLHVQPIGNAILQRSQCIIILLFQCFDNCSFNVCNRLQRSKRDNNSTFQLWGHNGKGEMREINYNVCIMWEKIEEARQQHTFSRISEYWGHLLITTSYSTSIFLTFSYISSAKGDVEWFVITPDHGTCSKEILIREKKQWSVINKWFFCLFGIRICRSWDSW